jgi:hypothetical protein
VSRDPQLDSQTVLVICGSSGIGLETARIAREDTPATVVVEAVGIDFRLTPLTEGCRASNGRLCYLPCERNPPAGRPQRSSEVEHVSSACPNR